LVVARLFLVGFVSIPTLEASRYALHLVQHRLMVLKMLPLALRRYETNILVVFLAEKRRESLL
jgi:hypothetical protein